MSTEQGIVSDRFMQEVLNGGNTGLLSDLVAANHVLHAPEGDLYGAEGVRIAVTEWRRGFPDLRVEIAESTMAGEWVMQRLILHGTHHGPFLGLPGSGRRVHIPGLWIQRIVGGRIVECWVSLDIVALHRQIHSATTPTTARPSWKNGEMGP